jgi:hypothetical protein
MAEQKEPMIGKSSRPTPIDYDAPLSGMKVRDLLGVLSAHSSANLEFYKPEYYKPDFYKEHFKPEIYKPDYLKEHKETIKEKEFIGGSGDPVEQLATRVAEILKNKK